MTKQPERFSELYFASPDQLPKQLIPGQNTAFDFVIVNHEAATYDYRYQVILIQDGAPFTHAEEQITLQDGQSHAQRVTLPPQEVDKKLQVIIRLPDKNQEIRFRTEVGA